ncbi:MAG TPA: DNA polymerase Y family protein [Acidimicrobiia bacterium]|jgi:protein ImuB
MGTAERMVCLWCPDWPVVTARRREPDLTGVAVAVLERGFVLSASTEARAGGVRRGLRKREAEARCPGLVTLPADPAAESRAFEVLAEAVEALAPKLVLERPGLLFVPTRGPSRYHGGDAALAARLGAEAGAAGVPEVQVGVADGTFAARLAARRAVPGEAVVVPPQGSPAFLAPWPVGVLNPGVRGVLGNTAELSSLLTRLGLRTLGDFAALPPASVLGRFGEAGLAAHRRARGEAEHPVATRVPAPELEVAHEFDPPTTRVDAAVFAGRALAERLSAALAGDGLACTRVRVEAETEHGERLVRCWRAGDGLSPALLAERVRWQLEAWVGGRPGVRGVPGDPGVRGVPGDPGTVEDATGGLSLLRLVPEEVVLAGRSQLGLWGGDRAAAERAARALVRLQALLGPEVVTVPVLRGGRTPDERVAWVPFGEEAPPPPPSEPWPGAIPPPAPALVFRPPRPAELLDAGGRPVTVSGRGQASAAPGRLHSPALPGGGGVVEGWAGPWLHDLRWWDPPSRRRRALWQVKVAGGVACLVAVEGGRASLEAVYD